MIDLSRGGKIVCTQKAEMTTVGRASLFITQFRAQNLKHETSFPPRQLAFYEIEAFFCPTTIQPHFTFRDQIKPQNQHERWKVDQNNLFCQQSKMN